MAHWLIYICPLNRILDYIAGILVAIIYKKAITNSKISSKLNKRSTVFIYFILLFLTYLTAHKVAIEYVYNIWFYPIVIITILYFSLSNSFLIRCFNNKQIYKTSKYVMYFFMIHQLCIRYLTIFYKILSLDIFIKVLFCLFVCTFFSFILKTIFQRKRNKYQKVRIR